MMNPSSSDTLINIRDLSFNRGAKVIFDNINLTFKKGKITGVMGPSGTGKTTLLRMIGGQLIPDSGSVQFENQEISDLSRADIYKVRRKMGMLFQSAALFSDLSVFENVAFPLRERTNLSDPLIHDLVLMKLEAVGLRGARDLMPAELSGGMARRVAFARALALDPDLIMFDEPFAGQDPITMGVLAKLIRLLNDSFHATSIIVSHDVHETVGIVDYLYVIGNGKVMGAGTPSELMEHGSPWVQQFLKGLPDGPVPFHYKARNYAQDLLEESVQ